MIPGECSSQDRVALLLTSFSEEYQFLGGSYGATGEVPLEDDNTVPAFKEVVLTMSSGFERDQNRNRQCSHSVGMGEDLVCKGKYYWGKFGDKEFLLKIALFLLEDFESCAEKRLCMEHFSRSTNPTAIKDCMELIECLSGLLSTYDALWGLSWKKELGPTLSTSSTFKRQLDFRARV